MSESEAARSNDTLSGSPAVLDLEDTGKATAPSDNPVKKYSFNLYQSDLAMLRDLVNWGVGTNITQALRAAIATEHYLRKAAENDERLFLEGSDRGRREIVFR